MITLKNSNITTALRYLLMSTNKPITFENCVLTESMNIDLIINKKINFKNVVIKRQD